MLNSKLLLYLFLYINLYSCTNCNVNKIVKNELIDTEINKVFDYYYNDKEKLQAAKFLTDNIYGHYYINNKDYADVVNELYSKYKNTPYFEKKTISVINSFIYTNSPFSSKVFDKDFITSEFLIKHIDQAFFIKENCFWSEFYDFNTFCENILPYRIFNELPTFYNNKFIINELIRLANQHSTYFTGDLEYIVQLSQKMISKMDFKYHYWDIKHPYIDETYNIGCRESTIKDCFLYNSLGIPCSYDFVPYWGNKDGMHAWALIHDGSIISLKNFAKIYRRTFYMNEIPNNPQKGESIPIFFQDPYNKDVTLLYGNNGSISINMKDTFSNKFNYIYLYIYNNNDWRPIAWIENKKGKIKIDNIGKDVVYLPIYNSNDSIIIANYPILLRQNGSNHELKPDKNHLINFKLKRKYPLNINKIIWLDNMDGAMVTAQTNNGSLDTLCALSFDNATSYKLMLNTNNSYNIFTIKSNNYFQLSKFNLWDLNNNIINIDIVNPTYSNEYNSIDNNDLTYTYPIKEISFKIKNAKKTVSYLEVFPRNDGNWIDINDEYQLMYLDNNGWKIHDKKIATQNYIEFKSVPSNCLYLLKNLTKGKEERPFTYENGKMKFW